VAPSTANTIGKAAAAIDDTPVTTLLTTAIGAGIPIVIAPAMHMSMYKHPIVIENIRKLREIGINILIPRIEEEKAKIPNTDDIIQAVVDELSQQRDFEGYSILITAGPTREYIDGFRFISNPSSGKTGVEIATEALRRGARVTMIYGPGSEPPPMGADIVNIISTEDMLEAVKEALREKNTDVAILSAAASDYAPEVREMIKTPSRKKEWTIKLRSLPKIIEHVKDIDPDIFLVGFKAEFNVSDEELIERAKKTMNLSDMDIIVANDVARENRGFATATNEVYIIDKEGSVEHVPLTGKKVIAKTLFKTIKDKLELN
jgi:phosphopantothenoylcysteine decarboxylase/phosphopantothenate--cysteine ligase